MYRGGINNGGVDWEYFDKFRDITDKYMPSRGEGETMANQIVTAINKLIYKWYNDGDVFDNTHYMTGWCNNLSSFANWLYKYAHATMLDAIADCFNDADYEYILKALADAYLNEDRLSDFDKEKQGTIYECDGKFRFAEDWEEEDW